MIAGPNRLRACVALALVLPTLAVPIPLWHTHAGPGPGSCCRPGVHLAAGALCDQHSESCALCLTAAGVVATLAFDAPASTILRSDRCPVQAYPAPDWRRLLPGRARAPPLT